MVSGYFVPIRFDPEDDQVMYGMASRSGDNCTEATQKKGYSITCLWRSVDAGESFVFLESPIGNLKSLAVSSDSLYLTALGMLFRSSDRGDSWWQVNSRGRSGRPAFHCPAASFNSLLARRALDCVRHSVVPRALHE